MDDSEFSSFIFMIMSCFKFLHFFFFNNSNVIVSFWHYMGTHINLVNTTTICYMDIYTFSCSSVRWDKASMTIMIIMYLSVFYLESHLKFSYNHVSKIIVSIKKENHSEDHSLCCCLSRVVFVSFTISPTCTSHLVARLLDIYS